MFKIFNKPRAIVNGREAAMLYPDKAYIIINAVEIIEVRNGEDIHCGSRGELYAIADNTPEDTHKYYEALRELTGIKVYLTDSFRIED